MISYFKDSDIFRFIFLFLICLGIRFFFLTVDVALIPSARWLAIGEALLSNSSLYRDIWTTLEPFSAGTYMIITALFGKSFLALRIIAMLLVFIQAVLFNFYTNKSMVFTERTSLPGLFYILFASTNYDFYTLSPILMGLTFLLPVLNILFIDARIGDKPNNHFIAGLFVGVASLFYLPYALFLILTLLCFIAFSTFDIKRVFQLIFAFAFPWAVVATYYYFQGGLFEMIQQLLLGYIRSERIVYVDYIVILQNAAPLLILGALSFFYTATVSNLLNYQYSSIKMMLLWFVFCIISVYFMNEWSYYSTIPLIPCFAFLATHFFLYVERAWLREVAFVGMVLLFAFIHYNSFSIDYRRAENFTSSILTRLDQNVRYDGTPIENQQILILGVNHTAMIHNKIHTVYADWNLAKRDFLHLNNYARVSNVYSKLLSNKPDYILDEVQLMPLLFIKIPELKQYYEPDYNQKVYKKIKG
ncbi:MAG: DUF6427 family protein [Cytophagaceae bacterium]